MYTCGHLIYGTPPTEEIIQLIDKAAKEGNFDLADFKDAITQTEGWHSEYAGNELPAFYFGLKLAEFDDACDYVTLSLADLENQKKSAERKYLKLLNSFIADMEALDADVPFGIDWNAMLNLLQNPAVHIVWYTS